MKKLRDYLDEEGIKHRKFAEKIGITHQFLSDILSGKRSMPKKYWKKVQEASHGKITVQDFIDEFLKDIDDPTEKDQEN